MKKITTYFLPVAFAWLFSGCATQHALEAAKVTTSQINDKLASIEKAAISKDGQLCVFFVSDLTNSVKKTHYTLVLPLAEIQTNAQVQRVTFVGDRHDTITYATMKVPGRIIQANWTLLDNTNGDLTFIPVGNPVLVSSHDDAMHHSKGFIVPSGAKQAIYQTRITPIEFAYVDALVDRSFTVVTVDPTTVLTKHSGYYCILPLTVPVDIATCPFQAIYYGYMYVMLSGLGSTP